MTTPRPPELPPVYTARLSGAELDELLEDIATCASSVSTSFKGGSRAMASDPADTLSGVLEALAADTSVQIRYEHDGVQWSDTLRPSPDGVRLVRIQLPAPGNGSI